MFAILRHADYNIGTGSLTPAGIAASKKIAETLRQKPVAWKKVLTSIAPRTREMAAIIGQELGVPTETSPNLRMDGNIRGFYPPNDLEGSILITHLPVITRILRVWSDHFHHASEPPLTEIGSGYLIDSKKQSIEHIRP